MSDNRLGANTTVAPTGDGAFSAPVSGRRNNLLGARAGGYLTRICLRALVEVVPLPDPLVISAFFLRPGEEGR